MSGAASGAALTAVALACERGISLQAARKLLTQEPLFSGAVAGSPPESAGAALDTPPGSRRAGAESKGSVAGEAGREAAADPPAAASHPGAAA